MDGIDVYFAEIQCSSGMAHLKVSDLVLFTTILPGKVGTDEYECMIERVTGPELFVFY